MAVTTGVNASRIGGSSGSPYRYLAPAERQLMQVKWLGVSGQAPRGGKRPGAGWEVTFLTGPERWQVAPGSGVLTDASGVAYDVSTSTNAIEAFPTRPGAGTSRIDLLVLHILDAEIYSGETSSYSAQIELVSGTAAASPLAPTISFHNYLLLATITMPTGSTAPSIVQAIPRTVAAGGILPITNQAEQTTLDASGALYKGIRIFREDLGYELVNPTGTPGLSNWRSTQGAAVLFEGASDAGNSTTSTAYVNEAAGALSATFVAPPSGQVLYTFSAFNQGSSGVNSYHGYRLSGGATADPADNQALISTGAGYTGERTVRLTGLTPGTSYTLTSGAKVASGSVYVAYRRLLVQAL